MLEFFQLLLKAFRLKKENLGLEENLVRTKGMLESVENLVSKIQNRGNRKQRRARERQFRHSRARAKV